MKNLIILLLFLFSSQVFAQVPPDSLLGEYQVIQWKRTKGDTTWVKVKDWLLNLESVDTSTCKTRVFRYFEESQQWGLLGDFRLILPVGTGYCEGIQDNYYVSFLTKDSIYIHHYDITTPYPNFEQFDLEYIGRRPIPTGISVIKETTSEVDVLYPNPAHEKVVLPLVDVKNIQVYNSVGVLQEVSFVQSGENMELLVSDLISGLYLVVVANGDKGRVFRFVKE